MALSKCWTLPAIVAALACAACERAREPHPDVKSVPEVMATYKAFEDAWEKEDVAAAMALFEPKAVVFDPVPPGRFVGTEAIEGWVAGSFEALDGISIETSDMRMHVVGPAAWITARYVFSATQGGAAVRFEGDFTMNMLRLENDEWKVKVFHASHLPPQPGGT